MKEKRLHKKISVLCIVALCMVSAMLFTVLFAKASTDDGIKYEQLTYIGAGQVPQGVEKGYVFAGWYTEENGEAYITTDGFVSGRKYLAKLVPEKVLNVKAQVSSNLINGDEKDDDKAAIRFLTSIDSLDFSEVGFNINRPGKDPYDTGKNSNYVYREIWAVKGATQEDGWDENTKFTPQEVFENEVSQYFKTWTIGNISEGNYDTEIKVTPYWITPDGTRVEGVETVIKTVNMGRSWIYISDETIPEDEQCGTLEHPYTDLKTALSSIILEDGGKVIIKDGSTIEVPSTFKWEQRGYNLTITGKEKSSETLDFSQVVGMELGDSVTFSKITLKFNQDGNNGGTNGLVYACGNTLEIAEDVNADDNVNTIICGGHHAKNIKGNTSLIISAGKYRQIFGGGYKGDVDGNTNVVLTNITVYGESINRVYGGGYAGTVTGNTSITVGKGYNEGINAFEHKSYSFVFGGGEGEAGQESIVEGDTYVTVTDGAKSNYIYGGGFSYSEVQGTCHVIFENGEAMSVYGGSKRTGTLTSPAYQYPGKNGDTSVVMTGGEVEQIFGGSDSSSMTGNTNVEILGGIVVRRVYGGCYNEYGLGWATAGVVSGKTNVTIGPAATIEQKTSTQANQSHTHSSYKHSYSFDYSLCAISRYRTNSGDETGIMVVHETNPSGYNQLGYSSMSGVDSGTQYTNYLVTVEDGGTAIVEDGVLYIKTTDPAKYANVINTSNGDEVLRSLQGEGIYILPEVTNKSTKQDIKITFTDDRKGETLEDSRVHVENSNGSNDYPTLEEAIYAANKSEVETVVTLLDKVEISSTLLIDNSVNVTIQGEEGATITCDNPDINLFEVSGTGKLLLKNVNLESGKSSIYVNDGAEVTATNVNIARLAASSDPTAKEAALVYVGKDATFTLDGTSSVDGNELRGRGVYVDGNFVLNSGTISGNGKDSDRLEARGAGVYVASGATFNMNGPDALIEENYILGQAGAGVAVEGTFELNNGTIQNNSTTTNGGGILIAGTGSFKMTGGLITANVADQGAGIFTQSSDVTIAGGTIEKNIANTAGSGVYVHSGTLAMLGGTISNHGKDEPLKVQGAGVYVAGSATLTMDGDDALITDNYVNGEAGAGVRVHGTFNLEKGTIQNNSTTTNGGGIALVGSGSTLNMTGGIVTGNTANQGGGIFMQGTANISGGTITGNNHDGTNDGGGAGICVSGGMLNLSEKAAVTGNDGKKRVGAGIWVSSGTFNLDGGSIEGNFTSGNGGGILISANGTFNMTDGTVSGNSANQGGGIMIQSQNAEISGGTISGNTATGGEGGGGVYVHTGKLEMTGGQISRNGTDAKALNITGAGVTIRSGATFIMSEKAAITDNYTSKNGGGIYALGTFEMQGGTISGNTAAQGGGIYQAGDVTINAGTIEGNTGTTQAGGIQVAANKTLTIVNGKVIGNMCGSGTSGNGAGIHALGSTNIKLTGEGEISGNTAAGNVQGVFISSGADSTVTLHTSFTIGEDNEIRYNSIGTRGKDDPILIIVGDTWPKDYKVNLGFHSGTAKFYIKCETKEATPNETMARNIGDHVNQVKSENIPSYGKNNHVWGDNGGHIWTFGLPDEKGLVYVQ